MSGGGGRWRGHVIVVRGTSFAAAAQHEPPFVTAAGRDGQRSRRTCPRYACSGARGALFGSFISSSRSHFFPIQSSGTAATAAASDRGSSAVRAGGCYRRRCPPPPAHHPHKAVARDTAPRGRVRSSPDVRHERAPDTFPHVFAFSPLRRRRWHNTAGRSSASSSSLSAAVRRADKDVINSGGSCCCGAAGRELPPLLEVYLHA